MNYVIAQQDAEGRVLGDTDRSDRFTFGANLYREALRGGVAWKSDILVDPRATDLRIVVRHASNTALGSVTIPLDKIHFRAPAATSEPVPKTKSI